MLGECQTLLHNLFLQAQSSDTWLWKPDPVRGYTVRDAYQLLTAQETIPLETSEDLIWHKQ
ncbi:heat-shock protein, partial [Trifolium medium]|nr:heat-shock protein [Trifolium medium]